MKKYAFLIALAGLAAFSCSKEENGADVLNEEIIHFTAVANGTDSKTVVDAGEDWANWEASDQLKIVEYADGVKNKEGSAAIATLSTDHKTATFTATITGSFPDGAKASYVAAYPANRLSEGGSGATAFYRMMMPAAQSPVVGSFDPNADILLSAPVKKADDSRVTDGDELTFSFHRLGTAVKLSLSGITKDEKLSKVIIKAPVNIAGYVKVDMTNGGYKNDDSTPYSSESDAVTLTFNEDDWVIGDAGTADVWFRILPCVWASGSKLEVTVETDKAYYYRTEVKGSVITLPEDYKFVDGGRTRFAVGLASAVREEKDPSAGLADGNYLILAKNEDAYYALKAEGTGNDQMVSVDYSGDRTSYSGDADMVWSVTKSGSSYIIANDGKYLGYKGSSNKAYWLAPDENWTTANYLLSISASGDVWNVKLGERYLSKNTGNAFFAFYANTSQYEELLFVPATVSSKTTVTLSFSESAFNLTTATYDSFTGQVATPDYDVSPITYEMTGDAIGSVNSSTGAVTLNGSTGTATVTASFAGDATYRPATASYTITVSAVIYGPAYTKVTAAPADWSGEYLMVCESENKALSEISTTGTKYGIGADVTISSNAIASTATVDAYKVTIAKASEGDAYTLSFAGSYLNWGSGNSLSTAASESDNSRWTISASTTAGNWLITNVAQNTRVIWYNTGSPRFACYENKTETSSGYAAVQLYVLEDSRQDPGMSWSASAATATYATGNILSFTAPTLTQGNASSVTYSSSDETIATISAAGVVSVNLSGNDIKEGSTTISASFDGDANYKSQTVSYTLTVADGRDAVATPTFNPVAGEVAANTEVVFNCADSGVTFYYTTNGSKPTTASNQGSSVIIDVAKTVKVIAVKTGYKNSDVAEAAYTVQGVSPAPAGSGTWSDPYNAAKALEIIDALADNASTDASVYVAGTITEITEFSTSYHNATYIIQSGNASVTVFRGKNFNGTDFTDQASELAVNDAVIVYGKLKKYVNASGTTPEVDQNNYLFSRNGVIHLAKPAVTTTPDHANKKITVSWNTVDGATSYDVTCGTQSQNGITALTCEFTMPDYGTYDVQVTAKGGTGAVSAASDVKAVTLTDPSSGVTTGDEEYDTTSQGYTNQQAINSYEGTSFTVSFDKGTNSNAPKYYTSGTAIRCYGSNSFTVAGKSGYTLTKIELTFGSSDGTNAITTDSDTYSSGTWTGSASSVTFTIGGTTGNRRIRKITVYWQK